MSHLVHSAPIRAVHSKSRIALIAMVLGAFSILIALGVWQLQRRDWKNDLIARFEAALSKPPVQYAPPQPQADETAREFTRVQVSGHFLNAQTLKMLVPAPDPVREQTQDAFGYLLFTPLDFGKGIVFVNRGFVPGSMADNKAGIAGGEASVTGIVRLAAEPAWFTPSPDLAKRLFFSADIPAMAKAAVLNAGGVVSSEYIEAEPAPKAQDWPKARNPRELLGAIPNRHLEYALTWFGLAGALAAVFGFFIAKPN